MLIVKLTLKGQCHEIFDLCFFHQSTPHRALTHSLKPFRIWLRIRRNNRHYSSFSGVNDTAETLDLILIAVSAVSMTPLKPIQWCQWHRRNRFSGINDTAETTMIVKWKYHRDFSHNFFAVSAVSMTPRKQQWGSGLKFQRFQWHSW
jgi:membrane-bound metal-dependent hydrolase YbcI (DUF457 family)